MTGAFLLSHHPPSEHDRTYSLGGLHLCARCLGTYPTAVMALWAQFRHHTPLQHRFDVLAAVLLTLPALLDWSLGRLRAGSGRRQGNNVVRTFTGVCLGLGLGRTLYVHLQHPYPPSLIVQAALVTGVAVPVMLVSLRRNRAAP